MRRFVPPALLLGALSLSACAGTVMRWQPSLASHVPDSSTVRYGIRPGERPTSGQAVDWQRGRPRVVTASGDTIVVPEGATLEVRLKEKATHEKAGGVIGWALGVAISYAACPPPRRYCGEEDPTPLLGTGLGGLIGWLAKTDRWVQVRWDPP